HYSKKERKKVSCLRLGNEGFTGNLRLSDFVNLETFEIQMNAGITQNGKSNFINQVDISKNYNLVNISIPNYLGNDNLNIFSRLTKLRNLDIRGVWEQGFYQQKCVFSTSKFYGSLKALENCRQLETLNIQNTLIEEDLEYLPTDNLKKI